MNASILRTAVIALGACIAVLVGSSFYVVAEIRRIALGVENGALPASEVALRLQVAGADLAILTLGLAGVMVLIAGHASRVVLAPLAEVTRRCGLVGSGAFGERIPLEGPREIRALSRAVNEMASNLATREHQVLHAERLSTVGTLVAGVAHEINNPLSFLRINERVLSARLEAWARRPGLPEEDRREIEAALEVHAHNAEGLRRLSGIAAALESISRGPALDRSGQDVNRLVSGCLMVALHRFKHGYAIERRLEAKRQVNCDGGEISQVILNLILNAADAMAGGGTLTLSTTDEGEEVVVRVSDTGQGIPERYRSRMFQEFFTTKPDGVGLGLALAKRIVEAHAGTIAYESAPGEGTTFTVRLPAARTGPGTAAPPPAL